MLSEGKVAVGKVLEAMVRCVPRIEGDENGDCKIIDKN